jgi:hypothetical protein
MKGILPYLVRWARSAGTRDFYPALAALMVSTVQNIFFLNVHFFHLQQPGKAVVQGRLSMNVFLRSYTAPPPLTD